MPDRRVLQLREVLQEPLEGLPLGQPLRPGGGAPAEERGEERLRGAGDDPDDRPRGAGRHGGDREADHDEGDEHVDGVGGADPSRGSGIIGLKDRVEALGGTISVLSPPGHGTALHVQLPADPMAVPTLPGGTP